MKLNDALKSIRKATNAESLKDSNYAKVTDYLDTGSYAINRVLTGDIHKGFPVGRISCLFGLSQSGKSLIATHTAINALKENKVDVVYIFDSEGGILVDMFKKSGVDMSKINHIPVASVEQCSVKMLAIYDMLVKAREEWIDDPDNNDEIRALCILDSYGALAADKLINDAVKKDQMVQDMGLSAKLKNNLMRGLMMRVVQSNATLLVINHEYQDPAAMFSSKVHLMGGGKGLEFACHVILQCEKLLVKSADNEYLTGLENEDSDANEGFYKGNKLRFFVVKNRVAKPAYTATVFIDFNYGIAKYDGLIEDAINMKFLEKVRGGYICPSYSDKRITYKTLISDSSIWNTFIEDFNNKSKELMEYSNTTSKAIDEIEKEIDGIENENDEVIE